MRNFCITLPEFPERRTEAEKHFAEVGFQTEFFDGIYAEGFGINTTHPYMRDRKPGDELYFMGFKPTGIFLSHYALWMALNLLPDTHFFITEIDAKFDADWKPKFDKALQDAPADFDVLFIGSCCTNDLPQRHLGSNIYDVKYPMCLHAYVVAKKALPHLLATNRDCYAPIDISLTLHSFDKLKVLTLLPRIVSQFNTEISE